MTRGKSQAPLTRSVTVPAAVTSTVTTVWLVEDSGPNRVYSNGLQVRTGYTAQSTPRRYRTFSHATLQASPVASAPSGIVFHTTESLIVPLEQGLNRALKRTREDVLEHVRRDRLYNFVVDRFGQVYGVVPEDQCAFHAGHSVWADRERVYVDLNESFIGVSFEAQTDSVFAPSSAQLHAGRLLTEMLRSRYGIAEANCITHAQVSVNPENMRLGYHTDWASNFPFRELGLTSGYSAPVPAVQVFGFAYDDHFLAAIGGRPWDGLTAAEEHLVRDAGGHGMTAEQYRRHLQQKYKELRRHQVERAG
ncbi:MAG: N-acetylmuramoyl-L-alanine amidase, family 2 [Bryobacterales bacterium]|nr:N-acetylmuramoyl-L-alanine amidase, family 2 [Bryobacterales bacterium]